MSATAISIGLAGTTPVETVRSVARSAEAAGLRTLWLNETPEGDPFVGLAAAAEATERLLLGIGVVALDRNPGAALVERIEHSGIPLARFNLGVGSGRAPHAAAFVERNVGELRKLVSSPILVGALGPLVRRVGAEHADGLLLSWLSPETAAAARDEAITQASAVGRPRPWVALYARTAIDPDAHGALRSEAERYAALPGYAANFARIGRGPLDGAILATDAAELRAGVARYDGAIDELVLRAVTNDNSADEIRRIIDGLSG